MLRETSAVKLSGRNRNPIFFRIQPEFNDFLYINHPVTPGKTVAHFAQWWEELKVGPQFIATKNVFVSKCNSRLIDYPSCEFIEDYKPSAAKEADVGFVQIDDEEYNDKFALMGFVVRSHKHASDAFFSITLTGYDVGTVDQSVLVNIVPGVHEGTFATSFQDLYWATQGRLENVELDDVLGYLSTTPEVFEAFGLKIPTAQVSAWGVAVIICIQLYFFMYLRGLKRPLEASDDAWDIGWFAANEGLLPRVMLFITVSILPTVAVLFLARGSVDQQKTSIWLHESGCYISAYLGYLSWRNRPHVEIESAPSRRQLFE